MSDGDRECLYSLLIEVELPLQRQGGTSSERL